MTALVFLHGFTGAPASWDDVLLEFGAAPDGGPPEILRPVLFGHAPGIAEPKSFEDEVDRLACRLRTRDIGRAHLVGYSLGARIALGLLVRHGDLFSGATLLGAHPGLATAADRAARARADNRWIRLLEDLRIESFVRAWEARPLFAGGRATQPDRLEASRRIRLAHDPRRLAASLSVLGLAAMPDWGARLHEIEIPVTLVAGSRDEKFAALAHAMARDLPGARVELIPGASHNIVLEAPREVAAAIRKGAALHA